MLALSCRNWLKTILRRRPRLAAPTRRKPHRVRPWFECLEDRTVPAIALASLSAPGFSARPRGPRLVRGLATEPGALGFNSIRAITTPLLNVPLDNWQEVARNAGAALITGLALGGLYLFIALRERQFVSAPRAPEAAPAAAPSASLEDVLAQFKGGALSQEAAAERIRALAREGALV